MPADCCWSGMYVNIYTLLFLNEFVECLLFVIVCILVEPCCCYCCNMYGHWMSDCGLTEWPRPSNGRFIYTNKIAKLLLLVCPHFSPRNALLICWCNDCFIVVNTISLLMAWMLPLFVRTWVSPQTEQRDIFALQIAAKFQSQTNLLYRCRRKEYARYPSLHKRSGRITTTAAAIVFAPATTPVRSIVAA